MLRAYAVVSVLALAACADQGDESMYVFNNTAITGGSCVLTGTPDQPFISHGEIDAFSNQGYELHPLIQSRIVAVEGVDPIQKTIQLRSADVILTLKAISLQHPGGAFVTTNPNTMLGQFSALFSGALPPGGSVNVGVEVIPPDVLANVVAMSGGTFVAGAVDTLHAEVLVNVVIKGDLNGGEEVTSSPYLFPVSVCNDCILREIGACPVAGDVSTGNPCNPAQDGTVDCCRDVSGALICPATKM